MKSGHFDQLDAWKKSHLLVLRVYHLTATFPGDDRFDLVGRMRRAAVAVPVHIADGFGRGGDEGLALYRQARGALEALRYYFILAPDLGLEGVQPLHLEKCDEVAEKLDALIDEAES
ncbi:four helix bundle protein [Endothiovibrio diazotrophicus]